MLLPLVSILLVVRNEKEHLRRCLDSLVRQDYPRERIEFLFIDGCSDDGTYAILEKEVMELCEGGYIARLLVNKKKILASGWNLGLKEAHGDYVCRIDAHSVIIPSYVSTGVHCLLTPGNKLVAAVGGWCRHAGATRMGQVIAVLMSSKFAVGDSPFRRRPAAICKTDTAVYGIYRRSVFSEVGYFDERLARNQDMVMHFRLKTAGYTLLTHPDMEITYYVRNTLGRLLKKTFGDGKWVALAGRQYFRLRHKVPFLFVLYLTALLVIYVINGIWFSSIEAQAIVVVTTIPLLWYGILSIYFSLKTHCALWVRLLLAPLFFAFHVAYGIGTFCGYCQVLWERVILIVKCFSTDNPKPT